MNKFARLIFESAAAGKIEKNTAAELLKTLKTTEIRKNGDIAIIGMAARMPMADNIDEFWENLKNGVDCVTDFPETRRKDMDDYLRFTGEGGEDNKYCEGAYLREIDKFDHRFFRLSPREASLMSPNQRLFLETAWEAVEDAGYGGEKLVGSRTGVYIGYIADAIYDYKKIIMDTDPALLSEAFTGNVTPITASRISYLLDLKGPSMAIDTACSSSLVGVHLACRAIQDGECDMAIAGGVRTNLIRLKDQVKLGIESSDGRAKTFDDSSDGTGTGEGVAVILLKPLEKALKDGDNIYAVIKGSSVNQDGSSVGITAPNVLAQEEVIVNAWKDANIDPETITYIEAHGTGTKLGDPIEIDGIKRAFRRFTDKKQFCAIGSVKTNIGHLDNSAGIAGLIKAVMALYYKQLPPSIHFNKPNRKIDFTESPVYVNDRLKAWEKQDYPRRCGVSSFGLSGTNCHMVLEEAPEAKLEAKRDKNKINLLALSAKSDEALKALLERYSDFAAKSSCMELGDICYSANTGRGHYNNRLVLLLKSREDLEDKIRILLDRGLEGVQAEGIYYGEHKIVADSRKVAESGEITEGHVKELSKEAREIVCEIADSKDNSDEKYSQLCGLYIAGADIEWDLLYRNEKMRRISLPTYPFERKRCWLEIKKKAQKVAEAGKQLDYPLLDRYITQSFNQEIYTTKFSAEKYWALNEHRVGGNCVLVGTAYLEIAIEACKKYFPDNTVELRDVLFLTPMVVYENEPVEVQTVIRKEDGLFEFVVASKLTAGDSGEDVTWVKHVEGKILGIDSNMPEKLSIEDIKKQCSEGYYVPDMDNYSDSKILEFGPRWKNIRGMHLGKNESLSYIELSDEFTGELKDYILYPSLLDNALATKTVGDGSSVYLPFSYKSIHVYKSIPAKFYSYVRMKGIVTERSELLTFDVTLLDVTGAVIVEIEDYSRKKVHNTRMISGKTAESSSVYHEIGWIADSPVYGREKQYEGSILVLKDKKGLSCEIIEQIKKSGRQVIEVELGDAYEKGGSCRYVIDGSRASYDKLFNDMEASDLSQILHMATINGKQVAGSLEELEECQNTGVFNLFNMTKALLENGISQKIEIIVISEYVYSVTREEEFIKPENATLFGFAKVIGQENPNLSCRCIDIDGYVGADEVYREINADSGKNVVALRSGNRYIEEFRNVNVDNAGIRETGIKEDGVYLLTGGTGGIGLEISKYIAARNKAKIILVNRSDMPLQEKWDEILEKGEDTSTCRKIKAIREIRAAGSEVVCYSADVANEEQMKSVLEDIRRRFGKLNGIVHSAGIAGEGFIIHKDDGAFRRVMSPKVQGTWILDRYTSGDRLDFFVMFSSGTSLTGSSGQSDYTAANAYLDSFEALRNRSGSRTLTINWVAWKETGMAVEYGAAGDNIFKAITTDTAVNAFDEVLNRDIDRITIGEINYENEAVYSDAVFPFEFSEELKEERLRKRKLLGTSRVSKESSLSDVKLKGRKDGKYTQTEKQTAKIFGEVLGLDELDIYDNFYDLGGDSLIGMRIVNNINKEMGLQVEVTDLFKHITVKEFSACLDDKYLGRDGKGSFEVIQSVEESDFYKVSSAQKRMFILNRLEGENTSYNIPSVLMIHGKLDTKRAQEAFDKLVQRHETLRTTFDFVDEVPVQRVHKNVDFKISYMEADDSMIKDISREFIRPFNLSEAPLLRVGFVKLAEDRHLLLFDIHHIISDGVTMNILIKDFIDLYGGKNLPDIRIQYKDFSVWQEEFFKSEAVRKQEEYWLEAFKGELPVLSMPTDYPRPSVQSFEGATHTITLDTGLLNQLRAFSSKTGTTLYMLLLAAYNVLLSKYTGQEDIIIGSPIAGRHHADVENMVGVFVNTLAMRNRPHNAISFGEFLDEVKGNALQAYANQDYQFEELVDKLDIPRDMSRNPLFDTMFVMRNMGVPEMEIAGLKFVPCEFENEASVVDLTLLAIETAEKLNLRFEYCTRLFKRETIERLMKHFVNILKSVSTDPGKRLSDVDMLSEEEKKQILLDFNNTEAAYPKNKTIHQIFEEQVEKTPDRTAVIFESVKLTYSQLNEKANQLARTLRGKGVKADCIVGIITERSHQMMIGIMAVLKAGGAYLPIDPNYPADRIRYMLEDSGASLILTSGEFMGKIEFEGTVIDLKNEEVFTGNVSNPESVNTSRDLAYVIYTSGSTGKPKGSMIEHYSVINRLNWMQKKYPLNQDDVILQKTPFTFDVSVWELFWWAFAGAKVCFLAPGGEKDPSVIVDAIARNSITTMHFVPSMLNAFLEYIDSGIGKDKLVSLRQVFASGEALNLPQVQRFNRLLNNEYGTKLSNLYGPTEATVDVSYFDCSTGKKHELIPIGKPIDNIKLYIVDGKNNLQPIGVAGELCIAGDGLARGYLNRTELTEEKFVPDPFALQAYSNRQSIGRMYRTGDLARWLPDGNVEYLGRIDHQVKIRGFRIELGEIEAQLLKNKYIREAVVTAVEDSDGNKNLAAYMVSDTEIEQTDLKACLLKEVPDYMVPAYFIRMEKMPLSQNGKVDRKALPKPTVSIGAGAVYESPANKTEEEIAAIWSDVLKVENIGINDNFFNLGGDSIKAISLISRINKKLAANMQMKDIYINQTIRELAVNIGKSTLTTVQSDLECGLGIIEDIKKNILSDEKQASKLPKDYEDFYPLSQIQQGMVFYSRLKPEEPVYHEQFVYVIESGEFDIELYREAIRIMVQKHSMMRTTFDMTRFSEPVQIVHRDIPLDVELEDISDIPKYEQEKHLEAYMLNDLKNKFKFEDDLLWRLRIFKLDSLNYCIVLTFHHAILDGWSVASFNSEIIDVYSRLVGKEKYSNTKLSSSYKEYIAISLSRKVSEDTKKFWKETLGGYTRNKLPFNFLTKKLNTGKSVQVYEKTPETGLVAALEEKAREYGCTLKEICLSAHIYLLSLITTETDITTGVVTHDRPTVEDADKVIGCFVNTIPVRVSVNADTDKHALVKAVKQYLINVKQHELFLSDIVEIIGDTGKGTGNPISDILFNFTDFYVMDNINSTEVVKSSEYGLNIERMEMTNTLFDLEVSKTLNNFSVRIRYSPNYFHTQDIETAYRLYIRILEKFTEAGNEKLTPDILMPDTEKSRLMQYSYSYAHYPHNRTIQELFEEQVEKTPDSIAAVFEGKKLTYKELNEKVNRLARVLRKKGVQRDDKVGIMIERSLDIAIAVLGVVKAGGACLPIDPEYPAERIKYMLEDSKAGILITQQELPEKAAFTGTVVELNSINTCSEDTANPEVVSEPHDLLYVIYTSGTTGKPKGVMIEQRNMLNLVYYQYTSTNIDFSGKVTQYATISFDVCYQEIFSTLLAGGELHIISGERRRSVEGLLDYIGNNSIDVAFLPTAFFKFIQNDDEYIKRIPANLKHIVTAGEQLSVSERFREHVRNNRLYLHNHYGPSETHVVTTLTMGCAEDMPDQPSIGKPVANTRIYILDRNGKLQIQGVAGELFISGDSVGRGYLNRPDLSREKFLSDTFFEGNRMYRTGDMARWLPDGNIEFLGRADHQVKIRGFRIELEEVEAQLLSYEPVKAAAVVARADSSGTNSLCAYVVADKKLIVSELREFMTRRLPDYMIPSFFVQLDSIPLTHNGKVNRNVLPEPDTTCMNGDYTAPSGSTEERLANLWSEVLGVERISVNANFFDLGGQSLKAAVLVSRIYKEFGVEIPLREIFRLATVRELAGYVDERQAVKEGLQSEANNNEDTVYVRADHSAGSNPEGRRFNKGYMPANKYPPYYNCLFSILVEKLVYENGVSVEKGFVPAALGISLIGYGYENNGSLSGKIKFKAIPYSKYAGLWNFFDNYGIKLKLKAFSSCQEGIDYCKDRLSRNEMLIIHGSTYDLYYTPEYRIEEKEWARRLDEGVEINARLTLEHIEAPHAYLLIDITESGYLVYDPVFNFYGEITESSFRKSFEGVKGLKFLENERVYKISQPYLISELDTSEIRKFTLEEIGLDILKQNINGYISSKSGNIDLYYAEKDKYNYTITTGLSAILELMKTLNEARGYKEEYSSLKAFMCDMFNAWKYAYIFFIDFLRDFSKHWKLPEDVINRFERVVNQFEEIYSLSYSAKISDMDSCIESAIDKLEIIYREQREMYERLKSDLRIFQD
ncbi:MAG: amino acid adenylation domain-containing protein [Clostridia bacterium]|nr:amino acid adenylation domain-containing protein [Clostridia bacterium]